MKNAATMQAKRNAPMETGNRFFAPGMVRQKPMDECYHIRTPIVTCRAMSRADLMGGTKIRRRIKA